MARSTDGVTPTRADQAISAIGLQGVNKQGFSVMGFPTIAITGLTTLTQNRGGVNLDQRNFEYSDSLTWSHGRHVIKMGGELRTFRDFSGAIPAETFGSFSFNGSFTGSPYADFLLGIPLTSSRVDPITNRTQRAYEFGAFVTDTFKVSRKLTLDLGLRWDYFRHAKFQDGLQYNWDPVSGNVMVPDQARSKVSPLYSPQITIATGSVIPHRRKPISGLGSGRHTALRKNSWCAVDTGSTRKPLGICIERRVLDPSRLARRTRRIASWTAPRSSHSRIRSRLHSRAPRFHRRACPGTRSRRRMGPFTSTT